MSVHFISMSTGAWRTEEELVLWWIMMVIFFQVTVKRLVYLILILHQLVLSMFDPVLWWYEYTMHTWHCRVLSIKCNDSSGQIERKSIKWTRWFIPTVFKRLKHCIAEPLAMLYTQLLSVAAVPAEWKRSIITPVFKKGPAGNVCNYRPISLTCVPSKVTEPSRFLITWWVTTY